MKQVDKQKQREGVGGVGGGEWGGGGAVICDMRDRDS